MYSISNRICWTLSLFLLVFLTPQQICGQNASEIPRQNPAPWRPSFNPVNQNAVQPSTDGVSSSSVPAVGSAPRSRSIIQSPASSTSANPASANTPAYPGSAAGSNWNGASFSGSSFANSSLAGRAPTNNSASSANLNSASAAGATTNFPTNRIARNNVPASSPRLTRVTKTLDKLPNTAGQVWREYDISPYTSRITTSEEPQKAILDWILRETGTEMWFNEPIALLHANKKQLFVYHTPEIQKVVKGIVDRFVWTQGQVQNIDINLVTVENPNWRSNSYSMLQPIDVKSPGVEAWMISKENAAILMAQLSKRGDFSKHSGGRLTNHDGQIFALEKTQPVQFIRNFRWMPNQVPSYQPLMTSLEEGYRLTISSLSSIDNETIEAMIKCDVDQVEKLTTVKVDVPVPSGAAAQKMNLQVPQVVSWRLHERFRWPNDQVLLLSCGVVASPEPESQRRGFRLPGLGQNLGPAPKRADALLFIDYRGPAQDAAVPLSAGQLGPVQQR